MKELIEDYMQGDYTLREWVIYGVLVPLALVVICLLAG